MTEQLLTSQENTIKLDIYTNQYTITSQDPTSLPAALMPTTFSTPESIGGFRGGEN